MHVSRIREIATTAAHRERRQAGFTLVELLVVIAIIAILAGALARTTRRI